MTFNSKNDVELGISDVQIGAVEGKDGASDNRWLISAANTARVVGNMVLAVQAIDASGAVVSTFSGACTIADGADVTQGAQADAKSTATDATPISLMQVLKEISYMEQNPASRVVTLADGVTAANKADINDADTARTIGTHVVATQNVCADGQVGIDILGQINEGQTRTLKAEGECDKASLTGWRELRTKDQRQLDLANCNDFTDYAALSNDTLNLADSLDHVFGTGSITFDKVNGADNKKYAGVDNTFTAINFSEIFEAGGFVGVGCKIPDITDVDYVFVRIGTDASNYNEWQMSSGNLTAAEWMALRMPTAAPDAYLGNGWNQAAVTYICFGVMFKVETDAQAGIVFDNVHIVGGRVTDSMSNTDPSVSQNINIAKVRGTRVPVNSGNKSDGCQRVVLATDDINMAAINSVQGAKTDAKNSATDATPLSLMEVMKQLSFSMQANAGNTEIMDDWDGAGNYANYCKSAMYIDNGSGTPVIALGDAAGNLQVDIASGSVTSACTVADGADVAQGTTTDARNTATDATSITIMQVLKEISYMEQNPASQAVTGTFYQVTQPVSLASAQVASGAFASGSIASGAVSAGAFVSGSILAGALADGADVTQGLKTDAAATATDATAVSVVSLLKQISKMEQAPASRAVTGTFFQVTQPVSEAAPASRAVTNAGSFAVQVDGGALWSTDISAALEASSVSKASAGILYKAFGRIDSTAASATYYIQLINASSLPADGAVTMLVAPIKIVHVTGTDSYFDLDVTGTDVISGVYASTGLVICCSSTEFTKTITAAMLSTTVLFA